MRSGAVIGRLCTASLVRQHPKSVLRNRSSSQLGVIHPQSSISNSFTSCIRRHSSTISNQSNATKIDASNQADTATKIKPDASAAATLDQVHINYNEDAFTEEEKEGEQRDTGRKRSLSTTMAHLPDNKYLSELPYHARVFDMLGLTSFSEAELKAAFTKLDRNGNGTVEYDEIRHVVENAYGGRQSRDFVSQSSIDFARMFQSEETAKTVSTAIKETNNDTEKPCEGAHHLHEPITFEVFNARVIEVANRVDSRVWPIAGAMFLTGTAIGVIIPVMPLFVKQLGLGMSDFGLVVAAFGVTKLLGNVPAAATSDRIGRKPLLTGGMLLISLSMLGISFCSSFEELIVCRLITGLGVSGFTTGATLYLTDISTPFNRTKSMAPISAAFSAGATCGPAVGGIAADAIGLSPTFGVVAAAFAGLSMYNHFVLTETLRPELRGSANKAAKEGNIISNTLKQWGPLLRDNRMRGILMMNSIYWIALSGSQMTVLPMMLVDPKFDLSPSGVGGMFALMSAVGVLCAQPAGYLADKYGKPPVIVAACSTIALATALFPYAETFPEMAGLLGLWALGGTMVGMAPTAYVADLVPPASRSQALALVRTTGDMGLLLGASTTGWVAENTSPGLAMQANSSLLLSTSMIFGFLTLRKGSANKAVV